MKVQMGNLLDMLYAHARLEAEFGHPDQREQAREVAAKADELRRSHPRSEYSRLYEEHFREADDPALQAWCNRVLDRVHETMVSVHHHPPVRKLKPIPEERVASYEVRMDRMAEWGYSFNRFEELGPYYGLDVIARASGLDLMSGNALIGTDRAKHTQVLNVLNGGADLDYEGLFPECEDIFRAIKLGKFHLSEAEADDTSARGSLSVPDILLGAYFNKRCRGWLVPDVTRARAVRAIGRILDTRIGNDERARLHHELRAIFGAYCKPEQRMDLLYRELAGIADNVSDPDVVITLNGGDLGAATFAARQAHARFFMPIGGQPPHQMKEGLGSAAAYSESDEMRAILLVRDYRSRYEDFPDHPIDFGPPCHVSPRSILPSDHVSIDTAGNAAQAKPRLALLAKLLERPVRVAVFSSILHARRARAEFMSAIPTEIATFYAVPVKDSAIHTDGFHFMKPVAIGQTFCEYLKRLYAVSVA